MSRYIVRYILRQPDRASAHNVTFRAFGFYDTLARFAAWRRRHHPFDSIGIIAVWSDAEVVCRARRRS